MEQQKLLDEFVKNLNNLYLQELRDAGIATKKAQEGSDKEVVCMTKGFEMGVRRAREMLLTLGGRRD